MSVSDDPSTSFHHAARACRVWLERWGGGEMASPVAPPFPSFSVSLRAPLSPHPRTPRATRTWMKRAPARSRDGQAQAKEAPCPLARAKRKKEGARRTHPRRLPAQLLAPSFSPLFLVVLRALFDALRRAHADPSCVAIVITGDGDRAFSAGFDIAQFASSSGGGGIDHSINAAFCELLEDGPKPTVAAIRSLALGGGLEVALACHARLATPGARLGLPELQLGILPGFGGTQRLPRLVGLQTGLQMILTSTPMPAEKALKAGLIDAVASPADLLPAACAWARGIADGTKPRLATLHRNDRLPPLGEALPLSLIHI